MDLGWIWWGETGRKEGRGDCGWNVLYERRINNKIINY